MSIVVNKTRLPVTQWQTESGSVVSISDARKRYAKSLSVALEPIQDLHGYSNPWVGGAGKNKFNKDTLSQANEYDNLANGYRYCDAIVLKPNTQYTFSPTSTASLGVSDYYVLYINPDASDPDYLVITNADVRYVVQAGTPKTVTFTTGATGAIRFGVVIQGSSGIKETALSAFMSIDYQLEEGSTATAWTPYSNLCPISGRSSVSVYDDPKYGGKIWWNQLFTDPSEDPQYTTKAIPAGTTFTAGDKILTVYRGSKKDESGSSPTSYLYFGKGLGIQTATYLNDYKFYTIVSTITADGLANGSVNSVWLYIANKTNLNFGSYNIYNLTQMFGAGNEPTTYAEFKSLFPKDYYDYNAGTETLVSAVNGDPCWNVLVSLGQTVYGGSVDVVSGVMTVTHGIIDMSAVNWNPDTNRAGVFYGGITGRFNGSNVLACSCYKVDNSYVSTSKDAYISGASSYGGSVVFFRDTTLAGKTRQEVQTARNGETIVYKLATPQTIQLSPNQIEMLMQNNTVWSDAGLVTLEYARIRQ